MYDFREVGIYDGYEDDNIPSEALIINDIPMELQIDGFQTLNVTGRELIAKKIQSQDVDNMDGNLFMEASYPTRDITIKYLLSASSNREFRRKFELLNYYLKNDQFIFGFNDDREYFYIGTLSGVEAFPEGTNKGVSSFTITCSDPFKYKRKQSVYISTTASVTINEPILYPTLPDEMAITISSSISSFTVKSGSLVLTFKGSFVSSDVVTIRPMADNQILLNGVPNVDIMTFDSPLEIFKLQENSVVASSIGKLAIKIRDKRL